MPDDVRMWRLKFDQNDVDVRREHRTRIQIRFPTCWSAFWGLKIPSERQLGDGEGNKEVMSRLHVWRGSAPQSNDFEFYWVWKNMRRGVGLKPDDEAAGVRREIEIRETI